MQSLTFSQRPRRFFVECIVSRLGLVSVCVPVLMPEGPHVRAILGEQDIFPAASGAIWHGISSPHCVIFGSG